MGETETDALTRGLHEEPGMVVRITEHFKMVIHPCDSFTIELIAYTCQFQAANYRLTDHDRYE